MLTFPNEVKCRYSDITLGHTLHSCWRDFVSFVNQMILNNFLMSA